MLHPSAYYFRKFAYCLREHCLKIVPSRMNLRSGDAVLIKNLIHHFVLFSAENYFAQRGKIPLSSFTAWDKKQRQDQVEFQALYVYLRHTILQLDELKRHAKFRQRSVILWKQLVHKSAVAKAEKELKDDSGGKLCNFRKKTYIYFHLYFGPWMICIWSVIQT